MDDMEMMQDIFEQFPTKESFDAFWQENYEPLVYADVKDAFESYAQQAEKHIFISDYEAAGAIRREDFLENLSEDAQFFFQDTLTEVFYDKNPQAYETAFAIYEEAQLLQNGKGAVAETFHQEYERLYRAFMNQLFDKYFA